MKRFYVFLSCLLVVLLVWAVPAEKKRMFVPLIQGGTVEVTFFGDENGYYYITDDGFLVRPVSGTDCFELTDKTLSDVYMQFKQTRMKISEQRETGLPVAIPRTGSPKVPVILVGFADVPFVVPDSDVSVAEYYDKYCNGTRDGVNYTGAGSYGSVRDYFIAQSDSLLQLDFQIIGPIQLPHDAAYYGADSLYADGKQDIDVNRKQFLEDAVAEALKKQDDWSTFDNNGDGKVDMAFLIYAGLGQANGGASQTIWPREMVSETEVNGIVFSVMAYCNQLRPMSGSDETARVQTDGIGIMCHELSHALGLPDFYNQQHLTFGMDYWSVMDYGYFAKNGYAPGSYHAYERDFMGWRRLRVLDKPQTVWIYPTEQGGCGYKIMNEANPNEYYVLHNLQKAGWDTMLATLGHGMLVTHVDYDSLIWCRNLVNADPEHQRMTIIPANNSLKGNFNSSTAQEMLRSLAGNPYPGITGNRALTDNTVPASVVFSGNYMGKPITQIEEKDGVISFKFMPLGQLQSVDVHSMTYDFTHRKLTWDAVPHATCYALEAGIGADNVEVIWRADSVFDENLILDTLPETDGMYRVRVKAMADAYEDAAFSEWFDITGTGITDISSNEQAVRVNVYSLQGICLFRQVVLSEIIGQLPAGVYLIRGTQMQKKIYIQE